ncbi:MAG: hypothetical protein V5A43_08910 [Haloarculaceae archaeon]
MVAVLDVVGLLAILFANTALAALLTRFFRVQMKTDWGTAVYTVFIVPVLQLVVLLLGSGVLNLGPDVGSPTMVVGLTILMPLAVGVAFDYFWMPAPGELDIPEGRSGPGRGSP